MRARREPLMIFGLRRSSGVMDRTIASARSRSLSLTCSSSSRYRPAPGSMPSRFPIGPSLRTMDSCSTKSSRVKPSPEASRPASVRGLVGVERLLRLLDQGEHVTQVEDPRRHPVRMEHVEVLELLARGREHDRAPGQLHDGQRGAAARVTVELGQHHAVVADPVQERLRGRHRVLADHRVDHEQDLVRLGGVPDRDGLRHHLRVDAQAARGVDDDHVLLAAPGLFQRVPRDGHRVADAVAGQRRVDRNARPLAEHLKLLHRVGPLQVGRDEHRGVALLPSATARAWPPAWSYPNPAGRPA